LSTVIHEDSLAGLYNVLHAKKAPGAKRGLVTHVVIGVWVLVLGLLGRGHFTVGAVVLAVVVGGAVVGYDHQLLDVSLDLKNHKRNRKS